MRRYAWAGLPVLLAVAAFPAIHARVQVAGGETPHQLPHQWRFWKYFREIRVPATSAPRLVALLVPRNVYARAERDLADLRIIDERGAEVPYAKITFTGATRTTFLPSRSLEGRYVPGRYTDFVLDLGRRPRSCNFLSVSAPATAANLAVLAEIDSSQDGIHWREVRKSAALFGSQALEHSPNPMLYFPETTARFLRLRIFYHGGKFSLRTMAAGHKATTPADRIAVTHFLAPSASSTPSTTLWQISLEGAIPADQADFETTQQEFSRSVLVFASRHGGTWRRVGLGMISRVHHEGGVEARMGVVFPAVRSRLWRVELHNESDLPLANVKLRLSMTPQRIIFWQRPGRSYLLLYGQSQVPEPEYDLAQTVPTINLRAAPLLATAEARQTNPAWVDPRPWSEKHAAVLWLATIVAALLLGLASIRAIRRPA
jgi:hypothetical protein